MAGPLTIHVIGAGYGESIVVHMPNGRVGVIDCFARQLKAETPEERLRANPTLRFLVEVLKTTSLAFLAFTHPREDHGRGLTHLLQHFPDGVARIWSFKYFLDVALERWFRAALERDARLPLERLLDEPAGTFYFELIRFGRLVLQHLRRTSPPPAQFRDFCGLSPFFTIEEEPIRFRFLGPTDGLALAYHADLIHNMEGLVEEQVGGGLHVSPDWRPDATNHNRISPALLLEYGKTRILLGGDMERHAWQTFLDEDDRAESDTALGCHLVKISHHGSPTGPPAALYQRLARGKKLPLAILTPYNRNVSPLPSVAGLATFLHRGDKLFATNLPEAQFALALGGDDSAPEEPLPGELLALLADHPHFGGAIDPRIHPLPAGSHPVEDLEGDLIATLEANPALARFLRPQLRRRWRRGSLPTSEAPESDCRVSFSFNDRGQELRRLRYVGPLAGEVPSTAG